MLVAIDPRLVDASFGIDERHYSRPVGVVALGKWIVAEMFLAQCPCAGCCSREDQCNRKQAWESSHGMVLGVLDRAWCRSVSASDRDGAETEGVDFGFH